MELKNEEIDVVELFGNILAFLRANALVLVLVFVLGLILGYFRAKDKSDSSHTYYRTQLIIGSNFTSTTEVLRVGRVFTEEAQSNNPKKNKIFQSIYFADCIKDPLDEKNPEINIAIESKEKIDVGALQKEIQNRLKESVEFKTNYEVELEYVAKQLKVVNKQLEVQSSQSSAEETNSYVKLLETKKDIEKRMKVLDNPVKCYAIPPLNKINEAPKFSWLLVFLYGLVFCSLASMLILFIRVIKQVNA